jgi:hypothetical protein
VKIEAVAVAASAAPIKAMVKQTAAMASAELRRKRYVTGMDLENIAAPSPQGLSQR